MPGHTTGMSGATRRLHRLFSDHSAVAPPDPIPNSEVKRSRADGSVPRACESRSSLSSIEKPPVDWPGVLFFGGGISGR